MTPLEHVRATALALPEATERPFGGHTAPTFRVREKIFVFVAEDATWLMCKASHNAKA